MVHGRVKVKTTKVQSPEGNQASSDSNASAASGSYFMVTCWRDL